MPLFRRKHKPSAAATAFRSVEHLPAAVPRVYPDDDLDRRFSASTSRDPLPLPPSRTPTATTTATTTKTIPPSASTPSITPIDTPSPPNPAPQPRHPANTPLGRSKSQRQGPSNSISNSSSDDSPVLAHAASPAPTLDADPPTQSWPLPDQPLKSADPEPRKSRRSIFSLHSSVAREQSGGILQRTRSVKKTPPTVEPRRIPIQQRPVSVDTTSEPRPATSWSREHELDAPWQKIPQPPRQSPPQQQQQQQQQQPQPQQQPQLQQQPQPKPKPNLSRSPNSNKLRLRPRLADRKKLCFRPRTNLSLIPLRPNLKPRPDHPCRRTQGPSTHAPPVHRIPLSPDPTPTRPPRPPGELAPTQPQLDPTVGARPPSRQSIGPPSPLRPLPNPPDTVASGMSERPSGPPPGQPTPGHAPYAGNTQEAGFRTAAAQQPEQGRSTPSSRDSRRDAREESDLDVRALVQKHDELQAKYSKVKRYYFEKEAQVQHLQNTVAHQRMAVSRTVLDDNEYANRFGRLDGAIKDLAFAIRKDWETLPPWLSGVVNDDAHTVGTKEMTAIGRAVMSRWLVEELFERYFHPALEPTFSRQLKSIEMNLRRQQVKPCTEEDKENAIARISNWRRTTLDGLTNLQGPQADEHRSQLIDRLISHLVATLVSHLHDPAPPGLDTGARMIVENAVGIAEKIPLESRDICVEYIAPGSVIHEGTMKIEAGLPPLTHVRTESRGSDELDPADETDESGGGGGPGESSPPQQREQRMRSVFSSLMGRRTGPTAPPGPGDTRVVQEERERGPGRIRFASFVTAEVRGRGPMNVLVKAPVYLIE
ncbi:hypothetical protein BO70DRAFT_359776 [Aspergillus heteromorphus CBS 117.55]|uniref:S-adenosylmethionine-dependent methyltransferase-like protein n=1 Tax=Aspergillus heteromorphus CBS 117.55 TaxID=1448321 RepID=A0A317WT21_9EURO|nr:uncharacterized protein BO70DRAFT_359776 [Aspergillus heteromorphus CBS 117.55]PWY88337.1 hypothetical protein BO70DRAFT_359776 [Aspergillus heteromorphus CBS 117.55]